MTRHEQTAGFMAATVGRLTGTAGVALSTLGPGATNLTTAAAYAYLGAFPALFITGQKPVLKSKQVRVQVAYRALGIWTCDLPLLDQAPQSQFQQ